MRRHAKGKIMNNVNKNPVKDEVIMTNEISRFRTVYDTEGIIWPGELEIVGLT